MKILYLSCHSILEYDEISLFNELGHYVFSPGAYVCPENMGDASLRPGLFNLNYDPEDVRLWHALGRPGKDNKELLTKEYVDRFDCVVVMHMPKWIKVNWDAMKHKPVVWRTIGQSIAGNEAELAPYRAQGLKIVRYSPRERTIPGYIGGDALVRFYKDPAEYVNWNGSKAQVITFAQHMQKRDFACNYTFFEEVTRPFHRKLFGPGNESAGDFAAGAQPFEQLKQELRDARAYFYTGTHPASVCLNFIESFMTGTPVVAIGPGHGNATYFPGHDLYEIPDIIKNGISGFISDDKNELQHYLKQLIDDRNLAEKISEAGRKTAIALFGKETIQMEWGKFLDSL